MPDVTACYGISVDFVAFFWEFSHIFLTMKQLAMLKLRNLP